MTEHDNRNPDLARLAQPYRPDSWRHDTDPRPVSVEPLSTSSAGSVWEPSSSDRALDAYADPYADRYGSAYRPERPSSDDGYRAGDLGSGRSAERVTTHETHTTAERYTTHRTHASAERYTTYEARTSPDTYTTPTSSGDYESRSHLTGAGSLPPLDPAPSRAWEPGTHDPSPYSSTSYAGDTPDSGHRSADWGTSTPAHDPAPQETSVYHTGAARAVPEPPAGREPQRPSSTPSAATSSGVRPVWLTAGAVTLHVASPLLMLLAVSAPVDGDPTWSRALAWSLMAVVASIVQIAPILRGTAAKVERHWTLAKVSGLGLVAFWLFITLPIVATNVGFLQTIAVATALGALWVDRGARARHEVAREGERAD
jgi:hypothetical protein